MRRVLIRTFPKDLVKAAVSGWLGTALEFMDFKSHAC
ncbi:TPA: transporter [Escherichia coli]|nr:transporter [Escherichia coli]HCS4953554.1 transporter [Escherichia coli]